MPDEKERTVTGLVYFNRVRQELQKAMTIDVVMAIRNAAAASERQVLICDQCGAESWNLASEGLSHDQPANEIKGYEACNGTWRLPDRAGDHRGGGAVIPFPIQKRTEADQ